MNTKNTGTHTRINHKYRKYSATQTISSPHQSKIELPDGSPLIIHDGFIQWPEPTIVEVGFTGVPVEYAVFEETAIIYLPMTVDFGAPLGETSFIVRPVFQACDDTTCLRSTPMPNSSAWADYGETVFINIVAPENVTLTTTSSIFDKFDGSVFTDIHAGVKAPSSGEIAFDAFGISFSLNANGPIGFVLLLLVAMCGGFLLNLTPCVLPVIPIKIMGLSAHAGNRRETFTLGLWMMFGVMALWVGLGCCNRSGE